MPQQEGGEKQADWVKKSKQEEKLQRTVGEKQADWVKKSKWGEMPQQEGGDDMYPEFWTHIYELG